MTFAERRGPWVALACGAWLSGCSPVDDVVFETLALEHRDEPLVLREGAGVVELPLRLSAAPRQAVSASYELREIEAQDGCQVPDFLSAQGTVSWAPGSQQATISFWVGDDDLAELDERLAISLTDIQGAVLLGSTEVPLVIEDDDRTGIVDAQHDFGVEPGLAADQGAALQAALDRAAELGRGVVYITPGDYEISAVTQTPGTTLSARDVRWHRPAHAPDANVTLSVALSAAMDSASTLIEGLTIDGRRAEQADFRAGEGNDAHLVSLSGSAERAGRLRATIEGVTLYDGTGSGLFLGPQTDAKLCRIRGDNLWRDVVTLRGGGSSVDLKELDASASEGTTGMWFGGQPEGYGGVRTIQVTLSDARLASGDLEIEGYGGSQIEVQRLSMTRGPLRIQAPNATVRILDSVLESGIPSPVHNYWGLPHDVEVTRTTLVVSETDDQGLEAPDADRSLAAASVRWELPSDAGPAAAAAGAPHHLLFDHCIFQRGADVGPADSIFAVESSSAVGRVLVQTPSLGPGIRAALLPPCAGCSVTP